MHERILVDANSLGHAAHQGTVLKVGDQETQAIFGVIKAARNFKMEYPGASLNFLWDGYSWRKKVSTEYKANRTSNAKLAEAAARYKTQVPIIKNALNLLGIPQVTAANLEADDLAGILSRRYVKAGEFVRMVSGDRDWWQLVQENCIWEDHRTDKIVTFRNFPEHSGYSDVTKFIQSKALQGDTSDNLKGVGMIGEKKATDLIEIWGSVQWFLADPDREGTWGSKRDGKMPKAFNDFAAMEERIGKFYENMRLMSLQDGCIPAPENLQIDKGELNRDGFKQLCQELGFVSIYSNGFDQWIKPFIK